MRFLLLQPYSAPVASILKSRSLLKGAAVVAPPTASETTTGGTGKAWGQQCGPNCGCVLRIEAELSEGSSNTSPIIVESSYHAKRVMITSHSRCSSNGGAAQLKPLTTHHNSRSQPILTSCTCPTLHHIAQRAVDHLHGKTVAQIRNELDMGIVGPRSSVAFRHTVLRESVLPAIDMTRRKKILDNLGENDAKITGEDEMDSTSKYDKCYDLVEDTLHAMIHERMPIQRSNDMAESYSPTMGEYFRMYSASRSLQLFEHGGDRLRNDNVDGKEDEGSGWLRKSPSSSFLFGDESMNSTSTSDALSLAGTLMQSMKYYFNDKLSDTESMPLTPTIEREASEFRPTTYLQMLDMYSNEIKENADERAKADWLEYVDRNSLENSA